jgi:hypothetical protein
MIADAALAGEKVAKDVAAIVKDSGRADDAAC